jgi:hypothetical protein
MSLQHQNRSLKIYLFQLPSLLHVPEKLKERIGHPKNSVYISFKEFLINNRGWISSVEITVDQASGKKPLSDSLNKMLETSSNIVIATFKGDQISFKKHE